MQKKTIIYFNISFCQLSGHASNKYFVEISDNMSASRNIFMPFLSPLV